MKLPEPRITPPDTYSAYDQGWNECLDWIRDNNDLVDDEPINMEQVREILEASATIMKEQLKALRDLPIVDRPQERA